MCFQSDDCYNGKLVFDRIGVCLWLSQASKGDNWDKTKTSDLSGAAARASADRAAEDKGGVLGPVLCYQSQNENTFNYVKAAA